MTVDKYRPIRLEPETISHPGRMVGSLWTVATLLALWGASDLQVRAIYRDPDAPLTKELQGLATDWATLSAAAGVKGAREFLVQHTHWIQETSRILQRPEVLVDTPEEEPEVVPEEDPTMPPLERWALNQPDVPERILIVGASSIAHALGTELQRELEERFPQVEVRRKGKISTGLTRHDVFDWPAEIRSLVEEFQPDVVICQFIGNDGQTIVSPDGALHNFGTDGWDAEYTRRVEGVTKDIEAAGATPIFLGMPIMRSGKFTRKIKRMNAVTEAATVATGGRYLSIWDYTTDRNGEYVVDVRHNGRTGRMRMDDGTHLTRLGGQWVAHNLIGDLQWEFPLMEPSDEHSTTFYPLHHDSPTRGEVPYAAFVPEFIPEEGLPVVYLLHGAEGSWRDWSGNAQDQLLTLAEQHHVIFIVPDGEPYGWYLDAGDHLLRSYFTQELLPFVEGVFPTSGKVGILGNSMGGHGALNIAMDLRTVNTVVSMSGVTDLPHAASRPQLQELLGTYDTNPAAWEAQSAVHRVLADPTALGPTEVFLTVGTEDLWFEPNRTFKDLRLSQGRPVKWQEVEGAGHTWDFWLAEIDGAVAWSANILHEGTYPEPVVEEPPAPETPENAEEGAAPTPEPPQGE